MAALLCHSLVRHTIIELSLKRRFKRMVREDTNQGEGRKQNFAAFKLLYMQVELIGKYKSLNSFQSEELKKFVVITGKNGSGKTQLLQAIQFNNKNANNGFSVILTPPVENLQSEGISFDNVEILHGQKFSQQVNDIYIKYTSISEPIREFLIELMENGLDLNTITKDTDFTPFINEADENKKKQKIIDLGNRFMGIHEFGNTFEKTYEANSRKFSEKIYTWKRSLIAVLEVAKYKGIEFQKVEKNDFYSTPLIETDYTNDNSFTVQIENLFYGYARKRLINEIEYNRKGGYGKINNSISPREFDELYPAPWTQINKILTKHNFKLQVMEIAPEDFSPEYDLNFHLLNSETREKITMEELSSGEKVIVGLIIRLFLTQTYKQHLQFPDCMLFDEPDALLHPEMSSLLIEVLQQTFTKDFGIQVIITTHSPSTVALSPDDCIYELTNGANTSLKNVTKDYALNLLTESLPLLSINYRNHRQIFVESPTDQYYYQIIFNKLKSEKKTLFDLYFITTGYGKSNCAEVIKLTSELRLAGNKTSYGIIDWDKSNEPAEFIMVNGYNKRYSIENFIFDPLHLCVLFVEQKCANNIGDLGFDNSYNQYSLADESEKRLQEISDWFFTKIEKEFPAFKLENLQETEYANGKKIKIPDWYLKIKGHELEIKLKKIFPSLAAFRNEGDLQKRLTEIASKCYPFIAIESIEILERLSNK